MLEEGIIITLEDNENYGLLLEGIIEEKSYFLALKLKENAETTDEYKVLKELEEKDGIYVVEEKDPLILNRLIEQYTIISEEDK